MPTKKGPSSVERIVCLAAGCTRGGACLVRRVTSEVSLFAYEPCHGCMITCMQRGLPLFIKDDVGIGLISLLISFAWLGFALLGLDGEIHR